ncbi:hypothetical protein H6P81_007477 [Aristolochia fimbriata]|uniref:Uncharacterized protein n=1 Tax=Aristolochia fimbriata TaxID=158543 RepID=A0AAV7F0M1_ARIFI|nr:hypothetical protein H6P81_007477 [Aristolochia fimbriata]
MLQSREGNGSHEQQPVNVALKPVASLKERYGEISGRLLKGVIGIFLLSSFLLVGFAVVIGQPSWKSPECVNFFEEPAFNASRRWIPPGNETDRNATNMSHVFFGLGGSARSWQARRHYSELWWKPGESRGFVWLDERPNYTWSGAGPPYRVSEDTSRFPFSSGSGTRSAVRLARILLESVRLRETGVRWYLLGDDDTVFFTENLVSVLGKYDHEEMYYVGGISESVEQDVMHSYGMAFGGGGFAVSHVLAEELAGLLDGCLLRYGYFYGSDQRVAACLAELGVPLTRELGFHQLDIRGDAYGILAAHPVAPLVSLHHLDNLKPLLPGKKSQEESLASIFGAASLDQGRAMQQSFGYDPERKWSVSVSWGYTVQIYPWVVPPYEMAKAFQTFKTWRSWQAGPFTFNTRAWPSDPCEQPLVYMLESATAVETELGTLTRSVYKKGVVENECRGKASYKEALKIEKVEVLAPKMGPDAWKKGPRRYCTEIDHKIINRSLIVKLRKCRAGQSFSPPP